MWYGCQKKKVQITAEKKPAVGFSKIDTFDFRLEVADKLRENPHRWKNFFKVRKMLAEKYTTTTPTAALYNATTLKRIAEKINDSLLIYELENAAMHSRLNAFKTAVLRLQDMSNIPAITATEVSEQVREIFYLHDAIVSKINTHYARKEMDSLMLFDEAKINFER